MSFPRLKTLRVRLVAWNTLVVLLIVLPTLLLVREGVSRLVHHEIGRILDEDISEIKLAIKQFPTDLPRLYRGLERQARGHARHGWFVQFFDAGGTLLWKSENTPDDLPADLPTDQSFREDVDSYRLLQKALDEPGNPARFVRVGASLRLAEEDLGLLTRTLIVVAVLITLLAPLGGYWLSGRAIQPLAQIIQQTSNMKPGNIDERLPLRGSGDELDQLSLTINGLLDRIAAYLSQKRDYLANAAHELRSPLAAIRGLVEVALTSERSTPEYINLLNEVMEESTGLGVLVNQLLLAEGDAGQLALNTQPIPLNQVVKKSMDMFEGVAESQGILLQAPELAAVKVAGDESHLRQLINNLLDNAIKFTPSGGQVTVDLSRQDGQARLRVADTGSGIPPDELPRIFERFYRGDKSRQHAGDRRGTGLGLAICQAIVAGHHGTIRVESDPGKGSTFTVDLPAQ